MPRPTWDRILGSSLLATAGGGWAVGVAQPVRPSTPRSRQEAAQRKCGGMEMDGFIELQTCKNRVGVMIERLLITRIWIRIKFR